MKLIIFTIFASIVTQTFASESLYANYVTMQLEYSNPDDLEEIFEDVKKVAKTCSQLDEFAINGKNIFFPIFSSKNLQRTYFKTF